MKTIAQQLNIKEFPFIINDKNGKVLYYEDSSNFWFKYERDENGYVLYSENSDGYWEKEERDKNGFTTYCEDSNGYWFRCERDEKGNILYIENSDGLIIDNRVTTMTKEEAEAKFNIKIK